MLLQQQQQQQQPQLVVVILPMACMWAEIMVLTAGPYCDDVATLNSAFYLLMASTVGMDFEIMFNTQRRCMRGLPAAQEALLQYQLYLGPLFFLIIGGLFVLTILISVFTALKATVKNEVSLLYESKLLLSWGWQQLPSPVGGGAPSNARAHRMLADMTALPTEARRAKLGLFRTASVVLPRSGTMPRSSTLTGPGAAAWPSASALAGLSTLGGAADAGRPRFFRSVSVYHRAAADRANSAGPDVAATDAHTQEQQQLQRHASEASAGSGVLSGISAASFTGILAGRGSVGAGRGAAMHASGGSGGGADDSTTLGGIRSGGGGLLAASPRQSLLAARPPASPLLLRGASTPRSPRQQRDGHGDGTFPAPSVRASAVSVSMASLAGGTGSRPHRLETTDPLHLIHLLRTGVARATGRSSTDNFSGPVDAEDLGGMRPEQVLSMLDAQLHPSRRVPRGHNLWSNVQLPASRASSATFPRGTGAGAGAPTSRPPPYRNKGAHAHAATATTGVRSPAGLRDGAVSGAHRQAVVGAVAGLEAHAAQVAVQLSAAGAQNVALSDTLAHAADALSARRAKRQQQAQQMQQPSSPTAASATAAEAGTLHPPAAPHLPVAHGQGAGGNVEEQPVLQRSSGTGSNGDGEATTRATPTLKPLPLSASSSPPSAKGGGGDVVVAAAAAVVTNPDGSEDGGRDATVRSIIIITMSSIGDAFVSHASLSDPSPTSSAASSGSTRGCLSSVLAMASGKASDAATASSRDSAAAAAVAATASNTSSATQSNGTSDRRSGLSSVLALDQAAAPAASATTSSLFPHISEPTQAGGGKGVITHE
ncbi:hypothetical protein FOA52_008981 [Chlamydomonas sp. UWO 241]|nr:hypothetical protein FOA52_008981 [Chlamydomonas sp. UWO 241]